MDHVVTPIINRIKTTPALLTGIGSESFIVAFANDGPGLIHTGLSKGIDLSKIAKSINPVTKLQKTIKTEHIDLAT